MCCGDSVKCVSQNKHEISICERTFLQKKTLRAQDFPPPCASRLHCISSCRHPAEHLLVSRGCPRVRPPPLGELFLEMGIIVKPCWCPFSLSLASPDPWEELTPQFLAIQEEAGGRGAHILGRMGWVLPGMSSHPWSQPHSPSENTKAERIQGHHTAGK